MSVLAKVLQKFNFVQNKLLCQTCQRGGLDIRLGGVYFYWQSQDIFIVFALRINFSNNQDSYFLSIKINCSSQIADNNHYFDAGAIASWDVCVQKKRLLLEFCVFCVFCVFALPATSY